MVRRRIRGKAWRSPTPGRCEGRDTPMTRGPERALERGVASLQDAKQCLAPTKDRNAFPMTSVLPLEHWSNQEGLCKPQLGAGRRSQNGCRGPLLRTAGVLPVLATPSCRAPTDCGRGTPSTSRGGSEGRRPSDLPHPASVRSSAAIASSSDSAARRDAVSSSSAAVGGGGSGNGSSPLIPCGPSSVPSRKRRCTPLIV